MTHNTCCFVSDEVCWLVDVVTLHQEVVAQCSSLDRKHQVASRFRTRIPNDVSPHLDRVGAKSVLR